MAAPPSSIDHGGTALLLVEGPKITRQRNDLDRVEALYHSATKFEFLPGAAFPGTGLTNVAIDEHECDPDGSDFFHRLRGVGIVGTKSSRMIYSRPTENLVGFDDGVEEWISNTRRKLVRGVSRLSGYANMVCDSAENVQLDATGWYRSVGRFRGIMSAKPTSRVISSNAEIVEKDNFVLVGAGGWSTPQHARVAWPKVTVTFRYVTTYIPTLYIPQQGATAPGDLYPVFTIAFTTNDDVTYQWPNGWRRASFNQETIPGTTITDTTDSWEFVQKITY